MVVEETWLLNSRESCERRVLGRGTAAQGTTVTTVLQASLVVRFRLPWQARTNIKQMDFHYPFPSATFMCLTHLSLRVLCDTSVKMFFLINNP